MKNKTLLILAAGIGSRFGGLKQMTPFGPNGEFIIDYSVFDAVRCGFNKIVFVIKEENYNEFKATIGKRIRDRLNGQNISIVYSFQNIDSIELFMKMPEGRKKPLGTAHAVLCTKNIIEEPFLMINSDDFYGYQAFKDASDYMDNNSTNIGIVGYNVKNTLSGNGAVKRGVCFTNNGKVTKLVESEIQINNNQIIAKPLNSNEQMVLPEETKASMNMIVFYPGIFSTIEERFREFINTADLLKDEFLIPDIVTYKIETDHEEVNLINTNSTWCGVTYKEDAEKVKSYINDQIEKGIYPNNLWN